jgi:ribA/ribD-fused uncharacterized protein
MNDITEFQGEFRWLSNFFPVQIEYEGLTYPSVEHAYQAGKLINIEDRKLFLIMSAGQAKKLWRNYPTYNLTEEFRLNLMYQLLSIKFNQEPFKSLLIATGDCYIQEGNRFGDTFFGYCLKTNQGKNHLGQMIMNIREKLL